MRQPIFGVRKIFSHPQAKPSEPFLSPSERKKNVVVRLHGQGKAEPILIFGHLDVVEAEKGDWSPDLDPFKLTERDEYFYGRGTQDMKGAATIAAVNFIRWKQEGWVPSRDLILALTGDEELYGDEDGIDWLLKARWCLHLPLTLHG